MKMNILKKDSRELQVELEGEGHTFCNMVQEALLKDKAIEFGGYNLPHPLISHPIIYVRTKGQTTAAKALERTLRELEKQIAEFKEELKKSWENNHQ
jgi:DNA-directed RNA polymerase subunit L